MLIMFTLYLSYIHQSTQHKSSAVAEKGHNALYHFEILQKTKAGTQYQTFDSTSGSRTEVSDKMLQKVESPAFLER